MKLRTVVVVAVAALLWVGTAGNAWADSVEVGPVRLPTGGRQVSPAAQSGTPLVGTFKLTAGACSGSATPKTYFRMVQPAGSAVNGPFVANADSSCANQTYTPLAPGKDGGLVTGGYQPNPNPAFDGGGNGTANRITEPAGFYGVRFSTATNASDPQTGTKVSAPTITNNGGKLGGDLRAFAAAWNGQHFNQGAPKPDGSSGGNTILPAGTYNPSSGAFTLEWTSLIVGGPFNGFTGVWHLEGTFVAAASSSAPAATTTPPASSGGRASSAGASRPAAVPTPTGTPPARTGPPYEPWLALTALGAGLVGAGLRRRARSA